MCVLASPFYGLNFYSVSKNISPTTRRLFRFLHLGISFGISTKPSPVIYGSLWPPCNFSWSLIEEFLEKSCFLDSYLSFFFHLHSHLSRLFQSVIATERFIRVSSDWTSVNIFNQAIFLPNICVCTYELASILRCFLFLSDAEIFHPFRKKS